MVMRIDDRHVRFENLFPTAIEPSLIGREKHLLNDIFGHFKILPAAQSAAAPDNPASRRSRLHTLTSRPVL
jgi:hypothetical protein